MSNTSRTILIGSLIGAAVGGAIVWAYHEFATDDEGTAGSRTRLQFQADAGDVVKLGIAVIPVVRQITHLFVPVDETPASVPTNGGRS